MSFVLCSSEAIIAKAGANVNATAVSSNALLSEYYDQAEGAINTETRFDWTDNYTKIGTNFVEVLAEVCSSIAANKLIAYDMSGYTSRFEAQTMLDVNRDTARIGIAVLKDSKVKEKLGVQ